MPNTKNQFERYDLLCRLLSRSRLTKKELLDSYHSEGFEVHWRTLNNDLDYLKDKGAIIHIRGKGDNRYYFTEQYIPEGSQFDDEDIEVFKQCIQLLRGINGFRLAQDLERVLEKSKYTRHIANEDTESYISFEDYTLASGTEYMEDLVVSIVQKTPLLIRYFGYTGKTEQEFVFSPYYLKEYRNRWYVFGLNHSNGFIMNLGLDRIKKLKKTDDVSFIKNEKFKPEEYFKYLIGVTMPSEKEPYEITFKVFKSSAPYVKSKPIFNNQQIIKENKDGSIIVKITAFNNYELRQNILGFGAEIKVLSPKKLADEIKETFEKGMSRYKKD